MNKKLLAGFAIGLVLVFCTKESSLADSYTLSADGASVVRLVPQGTVPASSLDRSLLNSGWTSSNGTGGSLSVSSYTAGYQNGIGGAEIKALYNHGAALSANQILEWVQVISTNVPLDGAISPYLDNAEKLTQPFYSYTADNRDLNLPRNQLNFYDFSKQDPASLSTTNPITWDASLYPVVWDGAGTTSITVQNGVSWGWTMKKAMVGDASGVFLNPSPSNAVVSGVGTSNFSWGVGASDESWLDFSGDMFDTCPNAKFKLGTLTYHNGAINSGTEADSIDFNVALDFDNVPEKNLNLNTSFSLFNSLNTSDPIASADRVQIGNYGYTFSVLEGVTATVDIYAMLSTDLTASPSGTSPSGAALWTSGFFDPSPDSYILTITDIMNPSSGGFITNPVPEPSTCLMFVAGIVTLLRLRRHFHIKPT